MTTDNHEISLRREVLLTFQVALLGMVEKHLRAVGVTWDDGRINAVLLYEDMPGDLEEETASDIEAEIMASFPEHEVSVKAQRFDAPADLEKLRLKAWVYRRRE
jgi:hypothetical protein